MQSIHRLLAAAALAALAGVAAAADHPVAADRLLLRDPGPPAKRRVRFRAAREPAVAPAGLADPRVAGATLEVRGAGSGDGATGPLPLGACDWRGLGDPPGSRGYKFLDGTRSAGVKRVIVKGGGHGGTLAITGGGAAWPYAVTQPQAGPIEVRLTIGDDVLCARFTDLGVNAAGKVKARDAAAPADCAPPPLPACGDGVLDAGEECDDGNTAAGDGCASDCQLESAAGLCAGVPSTPGTALRSVLFASGLDRPVHLTAPRLDPRRVFVTEQPGRIRIVQDGVLLPAPFLDIHEKVASGEERGLLSVAFHPDYEQNGLFFVDYTNTAGSTVIARYRVSADPQAADAASERVLLTIPQPFANHNGGQLAFGPDGYLYAGMGDGGSAGDPGERAQDPATLLGKLLRLDVDRAGPPWAAATNPFADGGATPPLDEIWALGLRNPWRFAFDRATGDLYVADVGQDAWEEIDVQPAASPGGENYGWDVFEGDGHCFEGDPECATPGQYVMPVLEYSHADGCSVTGGFVYRGCAMPDLDGTYFYGDFCSAFVRTFRGVAGGAAQNLADRTAELAPGGGRTIDAISSFGEDARGELYVLDLGDGEIFAIVPGS